MQLVILLERKEDSKREGGDVSRWRASEDSHAEREWGTR